MKRVNIKIVRQDGLDEAMRGEMLCLHRRYFANVQQEHFHSDLAEKDWCIIVEDGAGRLVGFSALQCRMEEAGGRDVMVLFSGDTIISREYWSSNAIAAGFGACLERVIGDNQGRECWWLLLSKGYRTYRFLPVYFHSFYPRYDCTLPAGIKRIMDELAGRRFGSRYDPELGVLRLNGRRDYLLPEFADVPEGKKSDPHTAFFLKRNPDFRSGNELVCLAQIAPANLNSRALRVIAGAAVRWEA